MDIERTSGSSRQVFIRYRNAVLLGCTALVAMAPTFSFGQEVENSGSETVLEPVLVLGNGTVLNTGNDSKSIVATETTGGGKMPTAILDTPASVSVITSKEIQERNAQNIEEALQYTAGVVTDFYGADDRFDFFRIRGFDAYTYRDGLALGRSFGGIREEPYAFERIEVLKGAASTTFGVSDPGGSVNYVTKLPKSERFGEAYVSGSSYKNGEAGVDFGDNITEDDTLSYRLTGKFQRGDAEYDHSRDDETFIMGGLTWRPGDNTSLSVVFDHLDSDGVPGSGGYPVGTDFDRSSFFGEPDFNYRGIDRNTVTVLFDHDFGNGLAFASSARYSKADTDFGYAYIASTPTDGSTVASRDFFANDSASDQFIVDAHLQYDASFNSVDSRSLVGVEYNKVESDNTTYYGAAPGIDWTNPVYTGAPGSVPLFTGEKDDQKTKAIYFQQDLTFFDKLIATVGLRNDWIDMKQDATSYWTGAPVVSSGENDLSEFTTRAGLTYKITEEFSAYGSYAESVVPASGLSLEPERGDQIEVGVKYQPEAFPALFTAAVYDLTKKDITVTDPVTLLPSTIGEVRVRGLDLEAKAELVNNLSLIAAYSYMDAEIAENGGVNEGNRPQFVPEHLASLWLSYELEGNGKRGDMTFGLGGRYMGAYFFDDANTQETGSSFLVDAAFSYKIRENTMLQVNVSNLFDEKHVAYGGFGADFYNPGREITATLRQTW